MSDSDSSDLEDLVLHAGPPSGNVIDSSVDLAPPEEKKNRRGSSFVDLNKYLDLLETDEPSAETSAETSAEPDLGTRTKNVAAAGAQPTPSGSRRESLGLEAMLLGDGSTGDANPIETILEEDLANKADEEAAENDSFEFEDLIMETGTAEGDGGAPAVQEPEANQTQTLPTSSAGPSLVGQAAPKHNREIPRMLAAKAALATRCDALGEAEGVTVGLDSRTKVEAGLRPLDSEQKAATESQDESNRLTLQFSAGKLGLDLRGRRVMRVRADTSADDLGYVLAHRFITLFCLHVVFVR
jgi:hypothetical protein